MSVSDRTEFAPSNKAHIKPQNFRAEGNIPECFMHTLRLLSQESSNAEAAYTS